MFRSGLRFYQYEWMLHMVKKFQVFFFSDEWVKFNETRKNIQEVQKEATKAEFIHQINNT